MLICPKCGHLGSVYIKRNKYVYFRHDDGHCYVGHIINVLAKLRNEKPTRKKPGRKASESKDRLLTSKKPTRKKPESRKAPDSEDRLFAEYLSKWVEKTFGIK